MKQKAKEQLYISCMHSPETCWNRFLRIVIRQLLRKYQIELDYNEKWFESQTYKCEFELSWIWTTEAQ